VENSENESSSKSSSSPQLSNVPSPAELRFGGGWRLIVPFALLPLAIVGAAVGVFFLFGMLADRDLEPSNYLRKMRTASPHQRWQAAYELSRFLAAGNAGKNREEFESEMLAFLQTAPDDDKLLHRYLILGLGQIGSEKSVPLLMKLVDVKNDPETRIYSIWALGRIGSPQALKLIEGETHSDDAGIRKTAAFSLGFVGGKSAVPRLVQLLDDTVADVRWNAALSLAETGSSIGQSEILFLLDADKLIAATPNLRDSERTQIMLSAVNAAAKLRLKTAKGPLEKIEKSKLDPALRKAATHALNAIAQLLTSDPQSE
jgi:HEAT repeat protein